MKSLLWKGDRFSWWFVGFVVAFASCWLAVDVAWRLISISITFFALGSLGVIAIVLGMLIFFWHRNV
jgi:hypothetical protein